MLKGYAGIGVVIASYQFTFDFLWTYGSQAHWSAALFPFIMPIIIILWVVPTIKPVGATQVRKWSYILDFANWLGLRNEFEFTVRELDGSTHRE
ncbi:MAG: hypothetical protein ACFFB7_08175 [Candidatus Sifarchaeia archaeon]